MIPSWFIGLLQPRNEYEKAAAATIKRFEMTDEPNVYTLRGEPVIDNRKAADDVVEGLEKMLEMARAGEIVAYVMVARCHDDSTFTSMRGKVSWAVVGRFDDAKQDVMNSLR